MLDVVLVLAVGVVLLVLAGAALAVAIRILTRGSSVDLPDSTIDSVSAGATMNANDPSGH